MASTSLNLNNLLEEDFALRNNDEKEIKINKRFLKLLPTKSKKIFCFKIRRKFKPLAREDIQQILIKNKLTSGNCETAVNEVIHRSYTINRSLFSGRYLRYQFNKLEDSSGNVFYKPHFYPEDLFFSQK